jgi:hypothetical protein
MFSSLQTRLFSIGAYLGAPHGARSQTGLSVSHSAGPGEAPFVLSGAEGGRPGPVAG